MVEMVIENNCVSCDRCYGCGRDREEVIYMTCDGCGDDCDELNDLDGEQLCNGCLASFFPKITYSNARKYL